MLMQNPQRQVPEISRSAWIAKTAVIVGDAVIGDDLFVAPNAVIRADEPGSSMVIGSNCNVLDNVVIHALSDSEVVIGSSTSLARGCIVHGPCRVGEGCFIGFGAVIFGCSVGKDTLIRHNATAKGAGIPSGRVVPDGQTITRPDGAKGLEDGFPSFVWGGKVVYVSQSGGSNIWIMDVDGTNRSELSGEGYNINPALVHVPVPCISDMQPSGTTDNNMPAIRANFSCSHGNISTVNLSVDRIDVTPNTNVTDSSVSYVPIEPLDCGDHNFTVEVKRLACSRLWT